MDRPVLESNLCGQSSSASFYAHGDRSLPARDRSPRAELSGLSQIFLVLAGCAYGDRSSPEGPDLQGPVPTRGIGPREQISLAEFPVGFGVLQPELKWRFSLGSKLGSWLSTAPPAASHLRLARAPAPTDRPHPPLAGPPTVRTPPTVPCPTVLRHCARYFAELRVAPALATVANRAPKCEHGLRHNETCQRVSRPGSKCLRSCCRSALLAGHPCRFEGSKMTVGEFRDSSWVPAESRCEFRNFRRVTAINFGKSIPVGLLVGIVI
uniref:Uncharacterized protein n=1 Tax=Ananas comosus var. bracteatus TaxID=296719 RepID=A0A6V7P9P6_ANACO|nr:unnamed protein product [Ananas comosus var. bracteatus]